jgi:hypothetical protein
MTKSKTILGVCALLASSLPMLAADQPTPTKSSAVLFGAGRVTRSITAPPYGLHEANPARLSAKPHFNGGTDGAIKNQEPFSAEFSLNYHVLGVGNGFPGYTVPDAPPDTTMAVGDTEILQWVNTEYADFNKSTGAIIQLNGQNFTEGNTIWANLIPGSACANSNDGDIIVKFDRAAHRWLMTQNVFSSPYFVCVAISQTATFSDNLWFAYQFNVPNHGFPDYPKWGVWSNSGASDGYYQTWEDFGPGGSSDSGPVACGYHRTKMLAGDPSAEQICFHLTITPQFQDHLVPADRYSPTAPPATENEFFVGSLGDVDNSHMSLYEMQINDWTTGNITFSGDQNSILLPIATFVPACNGQYGGACVPQKGITDLVDSLGDRVMYPFVYWEDRPSLTATATPPLPAPVQHWYFGHDVTGSSAQNAFRWYEVTANLHTVHANQLAVFQQQTYEGSPADTQWRWMGSMSRDNKDDLLVCYSESSGNTFPAIACAGRKVGDPLGTLSAEVFSVQGTGSQPDTSNRWGDYSTVAIDPTDNCTLYYTTEYYMLTQRFDWSTDISSWKFPNCQ